MPDIIVDYFETESPVNWQWPLQVGVLPGENANNNITALKMMHWNARLTRIFKLGRGRLHCNVLLLEGGMKKALRQIIDFRHPVRADVVVVFCKKNTDYANLPEAGLEAIADAVSGNGVFMVTEEIELAVWCDELVYNLAHNNDVFKAMTLFNQEGLCYISEQLEEATVLRNFTKKVIQNIEALPDSLKKMTTRSNMSVQEMGEKLAEGLPHFEFQHESGEASDIAEMATEITRGISEKAINEGIKEVRKVRGTTGESKARFLQSKILDEADNSVFKLLETGKLYHLKVRIGPSDVQWLQGTVNAPTEALFRGSDKEQELWVLFTSNLADGLERQKIVLPAAGASTEVAFPFSSDNHGQEFEGVIKVYYKNRLLQSAVVSAYFVEDLNDEDNFPGVKMEVTASPKFELDDLDSGTEFTASFEYQPEDEDGKLLASTDKKVSYKLETGLDKMLKKIKADIEEAVLHIDDYPEDLMDENIAGLFNRLAQKGRLLYDNYLKDSGDFSGPVQIISSLRDYIPLEFVYTYPVASDPNEEMEMCPNAVKALEAGKCEGCVKEEDDEAKYICPFGFLCFSKVIERHDINQNADLLERGDFALYSEPGAGGRNTIEPLESVVFASAKRVEKHATGLIQKVEDAIAAVSGTTEDATTWKQWKQLVEQERPNSLVLIVHTENNEDLDITQLEIGDKNFILQTGIKKSTIHPDASKPAPMVILIGCRTQDNDMPAFDLSSQFSNSGAALVLSSFTKIRGRHAGPIVIKLFEFFKAKKGQTIRFGEVMLQLRQYLLSKGIIVSLSLIAQGDADWEIKL